MYDSTNSREAFVTTLITDDYLPGVLVLNRTILETCRHRLFVLATRSLSDASYDTLRRNGIPFDLADDVLVDTSVLIKINPIYSHWAYTFFKLRIFELTQFNKIVSIDCDVMVLESIDDLFECPDMSAAIAGASYPGNENWRDLGSGVLVIEPRISVVEQLINIVPKIAAEKQNFGDQDVLIAYFPNWPDDERLHLPEAYNVFFDHYSFYLRRGAVKVLHFIGKKKPWMMSRLDILFQLFKCVLKNNINGIKIFLRYLRYLKK